MLPSRNLRWAGTGISNGRQRLISPGISHRAFSINSSITRTPRSTRFTSPLRNQATQQTRSLSLFGWGGSSNPSPDSASSSSSAANPEIGPVTTGLDNVRSVRASHATSDAPDPSQLHHHPPNNIEPQFIEKLQEQITLPHGAASEKVADIASGATDISSASEQMGYLKDVCGLDFGWGPSSVMENVLEHLHVTAGLSWTVSIIALAAILRLAMVKPIVDSQIQGQRMREIQPYMKPLRDKYQQHMAEGNRAKAAEVGAQIRELTKSSNISYTRAFVPLLIQLPFSFGAFRVLRNAGQLPVPAFVAEDWLWTTDLSFSDPYYITPAISAGAIWLSFRLQQKQQSANSVMGPQLMAMLGNALPVFSFVFMAFQPGSVQLYFMTTGVLALGTSSLIRQTWFRSWAGIGPLPTGEPATSVSAAGPKSVSAQVLPKKLPSNIQRIVPAAVATPKAVETENQPGSDRSMIDRAVDRVTGSWKGLTEGASKTGVFGKKLEDRQKDQRKAASARYQAQRQIELEKDRELRNQQAKQQ